MKNIMGKIIDFEIKGNIVRFYLGNKDEEWGWTNKNYKDSSNETPKWLKPSDDYYGDDWNDTPYECNAGRVYDEFIYGTRTYYYDINWKIIEPCDGEINSTYCKDDFKKRNIPCVIVIKGELANRYCYKDSFSFWFNYLRENDDYDNEDVELFYFEDYLMSGETLETERSSITV